jgi:hypothetical protein
MENEKEKKNVVEKSTRNPNVQREDILVGE